MFIYYVYAYLREDRTPYYIGKGSGQRAFKRNAQDRFPAPDLDRIEIIAYGLTEEDSFRIERDYISLFGRIINKTSKIQNVIIQKINTT